MKKFILAMLIGTSLTGCAVDSSDLKRLAGVPPTFTKQDLIGTWYCESSYSTWGAMTKEHYYFKADGTARNEGEMTVANDKGPGELKYKYTIVGNWDVDGWDLVQVQTAKPKLTKMHDAKNLQLLKKDPHLQIIDEGVEKLIFGAPQSAARTIVSVTPTEFTTKFRTSYEICSRVN